MSGDEEHCRMKCITSIFRLLSYITEALKHYQSSAAVHSEGTRWLMTYDSGSLTAAQLANLCTTSLEADKSQ